MILKSPPKVLKCFLWTSNNKKIPTNQPQNVLAEIA